MTPPVLTPSRTGAWIINITKHLLQFDATDPRLLAVANLYAAGKSGNLLIKLSSDEEDHLSQKRVIAHAQLCGIGPFEATSYLQMLQQHHCVDWNATGDEVVVLSFSRQRVLTTTAEIFNSIVTKSEVEVYLPALLEFCLRQPRFVSEIKETFGSLLQDEDVEAMLNVADAFQLLGSIKTPSGDRLVFNEYMFGERSLDIASALSALQPQRRQELTELLDTVGSQPGVGLNSVKASQEIRDLAVGLGLVEVSTVDSPAGRATFLTVPKLAPPSVGSEVGHLEDDVFHHAKMLLSSLRFGERHSGSGRGRIISPPVLVEALLNRTRVGPCTAIGQDYALLEGEGVVRTVAATGKRGQFYMELRRREPARIVLDLLHNSEHGELDARSLPGPLTIPAAGGFHGPEAVRPRAARRLASDHNMLMSRFLEELRT